jgi:hypothetical protein
VWLNICVCIYSYLIKKKRGKRSTYTTPRYTLKINKEEEEEEEEEEEDEESD